MKDFITQYCGLSSNPYYGQCSSPPLSISAGSLGKLETWIRELLFWLPESSVGLVAIFLAVCRCATGCSTILSMTVKNAHFSQTFTFCSHIMCILRWHSYHLVPSRWACHLLLHRFTCLGTRYIMIGFCTHNSDLIILMTFCCGRLHVTTTIPIVHLPTKVWRQWPSSLDSSLYLSWQSSSWAFRAKENLRWTQVLKATCELERPERRLHIRLCTCQLLSPTSNSTSLTKAQSSQCHVDKNLLIKI